MVANVFAGVAAKGDLQESASMILISFPNDTHQLFLSDPESAGRPHYKSFFLKLFIASHKGSTAHNSMMPVVNNIPLKLPKKSW